MAQSSRRSFMAGAAGIAAGGIVAGAAASVPGPEIDPDAELIALCRKHVVSIAAVNEFGGLGDERDPYWRAYSSTKTAITAAMPATLAGLAAKANVAEAERSSGPDGEPELTSSIGEDWCWQLMDDLLRIEGRT